MIVVSGTICHNLKTAALARPSNDACAHRLTLTMVKPRQAHHPGQVVNRWIAVETGDQCLLYFFKISQCDSGDPPVGVPMLSWR